jgi:hypothetical protein
MTHRKRAAGYALILAPAVAGTVFGAPGIATLIAVGLAALVATRTRVLTPPREQSRAFIENIVLGCVSLAVVLIAAPLAPSRYAALVVAVWIVVTDIVWRAWTRGAYADPGYSEFVNRRKRA